MGRAGGDDVAGLEGHTVGEDGNQFRDRENEVGGGAFLAEMVIHLRINGEWHRPVADHDGGAHGAEGIETLAAEPLEMFFLQISSGDIVDDGVAIHIFHGIFFGYIDAGLADDDAQLAFVVHLFGNRGMAVDFLIWSDDGSGGFGEENGIVRILCVHILVEFLHMGLVILADAKHIAAGVEGDFQAYILQGNRGDHLVFFIHFQRFGQVQKAVFAALNEFAHGFGKRNEISFFQIAGGVNGITISGQHAPLAVALVVIGYKSLHSIPSF